MNPYNWQLHNPEVAIARQEVGPVVEVLRRGGGAVVLGGRGMGKSVLLHQIRDEVEKAPDVRVLLFSSPPPELSVNACLAALARALSVSAQGVLNCRELFDAYWARDDVAPILVLLYDEFDRYAWRAPSGAKDPPGRRFFNDLETARRDLGCL